MATTSAAGEHSVSISASALGFMALAAILLVWEACARAGLVAAYVLPAPSAIGMALVELTLDGSLPRAAGFTLLLSATVVVSATVVGVSLGYLLYRLPAAGAAFDPLLGALFASPLPLAYPIFLVLFGRTITSILILAFIYSVIPVIIGTREGFLSVRPVLINVARTFHAGQHKLFWKVMVPAALPGMVSGIRLGIIYGLLAVIAFEYLTDMGGLGRLIAELNLRFLLPDTYAAIFAVVAMSALFHAVTHRIAGALAK